MLVSLFPTDAAQPQSGNSFSDEGGPSITFFDTEPSTASSDAPTDKKRPPVPLSILAFVFVLVMLLLLGLFIRLTRRHRRARGVNPDDEDDNDDEELLVPPEFS
jgi:hypothetical protein